jgi:hypothetical protein
MEDLSWHRFMDCGACGFAGAAIGTLFVSSGISPFFHFLMIIIACTLLILVSYKSTLPSVAEVRSKQTDTSDTRQAHPCSWINSILLHDL